MNTVNDIIESLPICDICNKPVDSIEGMESLSSDCLIFIARCHGDKDTAIISTIDRLESYSIGAGRAFVAKRIDTQKQP